MPKLAPTINRGRNGGYFIDPAILRGSVEMRMLAANGDVGLLRPWKENGRVYVAQRQYDDEGNICFNKAGDPNSGEKRIAVPVENASAFLRKDDWLAMDAAVVKVAKNRLRAVADLRAAGAQFTIPNGLSKFVLDTETQSDISAAEVSMDGIKRSKGDRPVYGLAGLPLPITHKDFGFPARQVMASRNGGSPLDTSTAELAARRVAESVEGQLTGTVTGMTFGGGTIYGYTNFPSRLTKTMTNPAATAWTPLTTLNEVLDMRQKAQNAKHYGPYVLYASLDWDAFLDEDYKSTNTQPITLRARLKMIDGISDVRTLDNLPTKCMVLVQQTQDVARVVVGMDITTVQWEEQGGMELSWKVMCIIVPQLRADYAGNTGIVHGSYT